MTMGSECAKCLKVMKVFGLSGHENWTVPVVEFSCPIV